MRDDAIGVGKVSATMHHVRNVRVIVNHDALDAANNDFSGVVQPFVKPLSIAKYFSPLFDIRFTFTQLSVKILRTFGATLG